MKTLTAIFALATAISAAPAIAADGNPFGLDLDKHPTEYGCSQEKKYWYRCETLPKSHPEFKFYGVQYVKGVGICYVNAIGKTIRNDSYGITTKARVDTIAKQLKQKYGVETDRLHLLFPGSIWDDPDDWMMGIRREERYYGYSWHPEDGFKPVGEVVKIYALAKAVSGYDGYVKVNFHFKREPQCDAIIEKDGQDAF